MTMKNITIFEKLERDNTSYRNTFVNYPPMPEEVLSWDIGLQELFCFLSIAYRDAGMSGEEAEEKAVRQVKESEWFLRWNK